MSHFLMLLHTLVGLRLMHLHFPQFKVVVSKNLSMSHLKLMVLTFKLNIFSYYGYHLLWNSKFQTPRNLMCMTNNIDNQCKWPQEKLINLPNNVSISQEQKENKVTSTQTIVHPVQSIQSIMRKRESIRLTILQELLYEITWWVTRKYSFKFIKTSHIFYPSVSHLSSSQYMNHTNSTYLKVYLNPFIYLKRSLKF